MVVNLALMFQNPWLSTEVGTVNCGQLKRDFPISNCASCAVDFSNLEARGVDETSKKPMANLPCFTAGKLLTNFKDDDDDFV